ncbi:GNAT family N-acetyltransferase [Halorussus lipolyticus]|uniref:GNAT family N-acetyltransferase n=1 Tax=Halorussus lipolyticus TaxID=3034024 RepID=UPI0023E888A1|nr:GNAT family N-acetyltransferase [Halorussus sp. DT80]
MSADATESDPDAASSADHPEFPHPPRTFTDGAGRAIRFRAVDDSAESSDDRDALTAMYDDFGPADRAQGIPPASPRRREDWLDRLSAGIEVVGWHDERAVAHGILLGGGPGHELALFVHPDYRRAGVGSATIRTLLGRGRSAGVERVWLSVQRTNRPAVRLYRNVGFETAGSGTGELEMARSL